MRRSAIAFLSLTTVLCAGCDPLKPARAILNSSSKACVFGDSGSCPEGELCSLENIPSGKAASPPKTVCTKRPAASAPLVRFPFGPTHPVECIQSAGNLNGDHSTSDRYFAIDLSSPASSKPGVVYAGMDGVALVYSGCHKENKDPSCGGGFGNHIRILQQNGLMLLYANLSETYVEDGQSLHSGDRIGLEGSTGLADRRALHLSAHFAPVENWLDALSKYREKPGMTPPSIPFELQYCNPSLPKECLRKRSRVEKLPCDGKQLRADWRT